MILKKINVFLLILIIAFLFPLRTNAQYFTDGKPVFVEISTEWCFACKMLKPIVEQLKTEYSGKVNFVTLDPGSEENLTKSLALAQELGIFDFFNANRNAFPTVGVLCSSSQNAEKVIIGANPIDIYRSVLNTTLTNSGYCALNTNSSISNNNIEMERPKEANFPQIVSTRPIETSHSGRPEELRFWKVGEEIPFSEYFKFVMIPRCSPGNNILCTNVAEQVIASPAQVSSAVSTSSVSAPIFRPWDPNATRNEKGFNVVGGK